ncbi:MAG: YigZ family protein [Clostridia bacterium]|nr:YigZ family protein [Clostridia bacterium]
MEPYVTLKKYASFEYEEKKSVFIADAAPASSEEEALAFIEAVKKKYPDARHHVYAYVLRENSIMRFTDDHEPQGTAGMPTLDAIRKNGITDCVVVVTRYFGGTLLGTGGLVRAYSAAAIGAIEAAEPARYDVYAEYSIKLSYSDHQKSVAVLSDMGFRTADTIFSDSVEILGTVLAMDAQILEKKLTDITAGRAKTEKISEKFDF